MFKWKQDRFYNGPYYTFILTILLLIFNSIRNEVDLNARNNLVTFSFIQHNTQRLSTLNVYKKKITETSRKIKRIKKSLYKLKSSSKDNKSSLDSVTDSIFDLKLMDNDIEVDEALADVTISLMKEQVKFLNLLMKRLIIFWNPSYNFGVDNLFNGPIDSCFLDMLGLGDKSIWDSSSYGGKLLKAIDTDMGDHNSIYKLVDSIQIYRYSIVYNYLLIIGSIYRRNKNFERNVRSRLRLFKNLREKLIISRDSLALLLHRDLPDEVNLPFPIPPPCYLDMGVNCNREIYNSISKEIAFFREIQDESKQLFIKIRDGQCRDHSYNGCSSCELRKTGISIIEWSISDIQFDIARLEKDSKLCLDSINEEKGGEHLDNQISHSPSIKSKEIDRKTTFATSKTGYPSVSVSLSDGKPSDLNFENETSVLEEFVEKDQLTFIGNSTDSEYSDKKIERIRRGSIRYGDNRRYRRRTVFSKRTKRSSKRSGSRIKKLSSRRRSKLEFSKSSESDVFEAADDLRQDSAFTQETAILCKTREFYPSACSISESDKVECFSEYSESNFDQELPSNSVKNSNGCESTNEKAFENSSLSKGTLNKEFNLNSGDSNSSIDNKFISGKKKKKYRARLLKR